MIIRFFRGSFQKAEAGLLKYRPGYNKGLGEVLLQCCFPQS